MFAEINDPLLTGKANRHFISYLPDSSDSEISLLIKTLSSLGFFDTTVCWFSSFFPECSSVSLTVSTSHLNIGVSHPLFSSLVFYLNNFFQPHKINYHNPDASSIYNSDPDFRKSRQQCIKLPTR